METKNNAVINPAEETDLKNRRYKNNLHIVGSDIESTFNKNAKTITVKTPLNSDKFKCESIEDISTQNGLSAIAYIISDQSGKPILNEEMKYLLEHTFEFKDVSPNFTINNNELVVIVFNDNSFDQTDSTNLKDLIRKFETTRTTNLCSNSIVSTDKDVEPKESCGDIIIKDK